MKINCFRTLPKKLGIAFSGGVDSRVILDLALHLDRKVILHTFDHQSETSEEEVFFANKIAKEYSLELHIGRTDKKLIGSKEHFWSQSRMSWFKSFDYPMATGHHLNDASETYLMTALTGNGGHYMEYSNENIIRPLLVTSRSQIEEYAKYFQLEYLIDPTNSDLDYNKRNRVRAELLPAALKINPGLLNTIKRNIVRKEFDK